MTHLNAWYLIAPGLLAAITVLAIWWKVWRKISGLIDELIGKPAQFGRAAKPGLIERLDLQDAAQETTNATLTEQGELLRAMRHELHPNSGSSLRDSADRTEAGLSRVEEKVDRTEAKLDQHMKQAVAQIEQGAADKAALWLEAERHTATITELAKAVQIAAQSTPPEEHHD